MIGGMPADDPRKQAEIDYPGAVGEAGREWIRSKPFGHNPRYTARLLIDFGHVVQLLELHAGVSLVELGCGSGWMSRLAARQGVHVEGYDIAPQMIEIARAEAEREGVDVRFEVGDYEQLDLGRRFDTCLLYDALHHSPRADLVLASDQGRQATEEYGVTEFGYSSRRLKGLLREHGFEHVRRFHNNRKRLFSNAPREVTAHLAEPFVFRALAPFWTQIWLTARAT
jgi:SAM-dependent methyltransferase